MFRLLDVVAAIAGRGYPPSAQIDVPLVIDDRHVSANCIAGRLHVSGGRGELVPDRSGSPSSSDSRALRLGANGLAALFAGTSTASLAVSGLLSGGTDESHAALDTAFAGRPAYLLDYF
jgi:predicted acetyltransferase